MITKMPTRIARTLLPVYFPGSKISIQQYLIEKNQIFQIVENELMFEPFSINNNHQNSDLTKFNGFIIQEIYDQQRIELSKNVENVQILICIDVFNRELSIEKEIIDNQITQIQNSSETPLSLLSSIPQCQAPFTVYLTKGNGFTTCYECLAENEKINIEMIEIVYDIDEHKLKPRDQRLEEYQGNNYKFEESIQQETLNYLKTFEIDSEFAQFVQHVQIYNENFQNMTNLQDKQNTS